MPSEARRGFARIASNYFRLISSVIMGLILVPVLLEAVGEDGWALIALLASTIGLASMVEEITRSSLIREMGHAYHRGPDDFRAVYNSAMAVTAVAALIAGVLFAVVWIIVPLLQIPPELVSAGRWLVVTRGVETMLTLQLAAPFNMYKVTERMTAFNLWQMSGRIGTLLAAVWVLLAFKHLDVGSRVVIYVVSSSALFVLFMVLAVLLIARKVEVSLWPRPRSITRDAVRTVLHVGGLNVAAATATNTHRRLAPVLMNLAYGLSGNLILGFALTVTVSVRRLTTGMTSGLDAVAARLSTVGEPEAVHSISRHSTRLHGVASFGLAVLVILLAEPLLLLWLGDRIKDPAATIPPAAALVRILTIGMLSRAISDGWQALLYGAGHVGSYAWYALAGVVIHPLLFWLFLVVLPESVGYTAASWAYSAVFLVMHALVTPWRGAPALGVPVSDFFVPLVRPLLVALACAPILLIARVPLAEWTLLRLAVAVGAYGTAYAIGCLLFVMHGHERQRFTRAALRRLPFGADGRRTAYDGRPATRPDDDGEPAERGEATSTGQEIGRAG